MSCYIPIRKFCFWNPCCSTKQVCAEMSLHFSIPGLLDFPPYCSSLLTVLLRAVSRFFRKSTELSGGLFWAACLLLIAQHMFNPLPPAVGPSLFQMSFLLSNHPTHSFWAGTPYFSGKSIVLCDLPWFHLIWTDFFLFTRCPENLLLLFYQYFVLYYSVSKPINTFWIFLKWDYSLNFENLFSLLLVGSQAILNNASWKLPFTSLAIKQEFFLLSSSCC